MLLCCELIVLCLLLFLICYLNTGNDEKNVRNGFRSYSNEVQQLIRENPALKDMIPTSSPTITFLSNLILFGVILFVCGLFIKTDNFKENFLNLLILGQGLNAFDFFIIDLLWWRNTKRVRITTTKDKSELYRNPYKHFVSFLKGIVMYLLIAVIDGLVLSLI